MLLLPLAGAAAAPVLRLVGDFDACSVDAVRVWHGRGRRGNPLGLEEVCALGSGDAAALLLLERAGRYLAALGEFKLAIQLDPDRRAAYRSLARLLCERVRLKVEFAR